jgi:hypothetical protein
VILDAEGKEAKPPPVMPEWHKDVQIMSLMQWCGHWFEFAGIDPDHDVDVIFFRYKEPTKRRAKCKTQ